MESFSNHSSNPQSSSTPPSNPSSVPVPFPVFCGLSILQQVAPERFQKAVAGLADGSLAVTITRQTDMAIYGLAKNSKGQEYNLSLAASGASCSCPDALFRHSVCKHGVALALAVLRLPNPEAESQESQQPVNLRLGKVRTHWSYPA